MYYIWYCSGQVTNNIHDCGNQLKKDHLMTEDDLRRFLKNTHKSFKVTSRYKFLLNRLLIYKNLKKALCD